MGKLEQAQQQTRELVGDMRKAAEEQQRRMEKLIADSQKQSGFCISLLPPGIRFRGNSFRGTGGGDEVDGRNAQGRWAVPLGKPQHRTLEKEAPVVQRKTETVAHPCRTGS